MGPLYEGPKWFNFVQRILMEPEIIIVMIVKGHYKSDPEILNTSTLPLYF